MSAAIKAVRGRAGLAASLRCTTPLFIAGVAALEAAAGKVARAQKTFERAIAQAEKHMLIGELYDVHRAAAASLGDSPERQFHLRRIQDLTVAFARREVI